MEKLYGRTHSRKHGAYLLYRLFADDSMKSYEGSWTLSVCLLAFRSYQSCIRDVGDQSLAECCFLDLPRCLTHIDDQPIDLKHPDEGILVNHRGGRPIGVHRIHPQQV